MKNSDLLIIAIGVIIIVSLFICLVYFAFMANTGNAGFHGTF